VIVGETDHWKRRNIGAAEAVAGLNVGLRLFELPALAESADTPVAMSATMTIVTNRLVTLASLVKPQA
jgi:hypothetical protein